MNARSCILLLLLVTGPAAAQLTEKAAVAQMTGEGKSGVADFAALSKATTKTLQASLDQVGQAVQIGGYAPEDFDLIFDALRAAQLQLRDDTETVGIVHLIALGQALSQLPQGPQGHYAAPLCRGAGGTVDDFHARLTKRLDKLAASLRKLLAALAKVLEKEAGFALSFRIEPPTRDFEGAANGFYPYTAWPAPGLTLTIDTVLAGSSLSVEMDGRLSVAGSADGDFGKVNVAITNDGGLNNFVQLVAPDPNTKRWTATFTGLKEGHYLIVARQADASMQVPRVDMAIGIR